MSESDGLICRAANVDDDLALRQLIAVPMTTRGVMLSFQREPSYFAASRVIYKVNDHAVVQDTRSNDIVAVYSNGYRPCYINGLKQDLRYACDLRIKPQVRGKHILIKHLFPRFQATMQDPNFSHIIIFNDNHAARAAIQSAKLGTADYYDEGLIETLTLTGFKAKYLAEKIIQNVTSNLSLDLSQVQVRTASASDVPAMNAFIVQMAAYYNYVLAYDFDELLAGDDYFQNLKIEDFQLYLLDGQIVGMFGLWRQSSFKQSKILDYGKLIAWARPFYNVWARWSGGMVLPKRGESFQYHSLHSLLCHPQHLALHDQMLRDAYALSQRAGIGCISYTLSQQDPRQKLNACYKGELLVGMHGFLCYEGNPLDFIDRNLIPFLEVGRI